MSTPTRPLSSNTRSRPKSSSLPENILDDSRPATSSSSRNGTLTVPTSPSLPTGFPIIPASSPLTSHHRAASTPNTPPSTANTVKKTTTTPTTPAPSSTPRKNGRRRYTPRQIHPPSTYRPAVHQSSSSPHASPSPKPSTSETDVTQFLSLTQQLNGQMDGLVDYHLIGGRWESGILYIDAPTSSLNRHYGSEGPQRLVSDLRGCRVDKVHGEDGQTLLVIKMSSGPGEITLRPPMTDIEKWFAALYRWRSVTRSPSARSLQSTGSNKSNNSPSGKESATPPQRRVLDIKIGSMLQLPQNRRVKSILKDNGVLSIFSEPIHRGEEELLSYTIHLGALPRSAIQLIDPSLSSQSYCFVIHAELRETASRTLEMRKMPIFLALDSRVQMEVWFVLLRCYATPELYGPPSLDPLDAFRCHRSLSLRVVEGRRLHRPVSSGDSMREKEMDSYCDIIIEGEIRGKTSVKKGTLRPLWNEDFEFTDLPEHIDDVAIILKYIRRNREMVLGKVTLNMMDTELGKSTQAWHPVIFTARDGLSVERVGELDLKYKLEELVILMSSDYTEIRKLLLDFKNGVTLELAKTVQDLDFLADRLIHVFLADNVAVDWLMYLANEEITAQFTQLKAQVAVAIDATELPSEDAEAHQQQTLKQEATRTLFRGNSLLTKSLMKFMEKVGKDYLEETLGPYLRYVVATSAMESCEVDPAHIKPGEDIDENWKRLLRHIREVWNRILISAKSCPPEFKIIFSSIQEKVIESAGDIPTISFARYTCISAFIFLRFFMPACLNPNICGIIRQPPDETQRRTLLLISKGLQGVSNMSGYGGKEKWILPMGTLSAEYEDQFTSFIDQICDTSNLTGPTQPAQYSGPGLVRSRLDALSQEGIPTLPFLIDQPREFAGLVKLWNRHLFPPLTTNSQKKHNSIDVAKLSEPMRAFHTACVQLNMKMVGLVETAVEREEEDLSEVEVVEEEITTAVAEMSVQNHQSAGNHHSIGSVMGSVRHSKKEVYRKTSFTTQEDEYSSSPPKRAFDAVWPGFLRKRPSEREKHHEREKSKD